MRRYWFRRTGPLNWTPDTREGWAVVIAFVSAVPVIDLLMIKNARTAPFTICWTMAAVAALILIVMKTGEPL